MEVDTHYVTVGADGNEFGHASDEIEPVRESTCLGLARDATMLTPVPAGG